MEQRLRDSATENSLAPLVGVSLGRWGRQPGCGPCRETGGDSEQQQGDSFQRRPEGRMERARAVDGDADWSLGGSAAAV